MSGATYIDLMNNFGAWNETHPLSSFAQTLWFQLLAVFNRAFWPPEVEVDERRMASLCGMGEKAFARALGELAESGLICCEPGTKHGRRRFRLELDTLCLRRQTSAHGPAFKSSPPSFDVEAFTRRALEQTPKIVA